MLEQLVAAGVEVRALVVHRRRERAAERLPQPQGGLGHLRVGEQPLLERLGPRHHLGVVLQVGSEPLEQVVERLSRGVARVLLDVAQPGQHLLVGPADHPVVDPRRRPPRRPLAEHGGIRSRVVGEPVAQLLQPEVDQAVVGLLVDDPLEQGAGDRCHRLLDEARHEEVLDQRTHLVVAEPPQPGGRDPHDLAAHPPAVLRHAQPQPDPLTHAGRREPVAGDLLGEEVLGHELLQVAPDLVLALGDDRGVWHGQTERVPEQGRDREPVGERADHRRLGGGVDVAPDPGLVEVERQRVDDRGEHQQRQGERPHPAQTGTAGGIRGRRGHETHDAILPHEPARPAPG